MPVSGPQERKEELDALRALRINVFETRLLVYAVRRVIFSVIPAAKVSRCSAASPTYRPSRTSLPMRLG